jgi:hypothetical protein
VDHSDAGLWQSWRVRGRASGVWSDISTMAAPNTFSELGLSIIGLDAEYPPYALNNKALDTLSRKFYPDTPA